MGSRPRRHGTLGGWPLHVAQGVAALLVAVLAGSILFVRLTADTCRRIPEGTPVATPEELAGIDVTEPLEDSTGVLYEEDFELFEPGARWRQGTVCASLRVEYHGYGTVGTTHGTSVVHMQAPRAASSKDRTHASMVTSTTKFEDIDFTLKTRTLRHLRKGNKPNPWEVSWIVWSYTDDDHFYYFIPKPNGWELGKRDPDYSGGQRDLKTSASPKFPIDRWYAVRVRQVGTQITVWVDDEQIVTFKDGDKPYTRGAIGLYNEDAEVQFDDIRVVRP